MIRHGHCWIKCDAQIFNSWWWRYHFGTNLKVDIRESIHVVRGCRNEKLGSLCHQAWACFIESQWICRIPCRIPYENASRMGVRILPIVCLGFIAVNNMLLILVLDGYKFNTMWGKDKQGWCVCTLVAITWSVAWVAPWSLFCLQRQLMIEVVNSTWWQFVEDCVNVWWYTNGDAWFGVGMTSGTFYWVQQGFERDGKVTLAGFLEHSKSGDLSPGGKGLPV